MRGLSVQIFFFGQDQFALMRHYREPTSQGEIPSASSAAPEITLKYETLNHGSIQLNGYWTENITVTVADGAGQNRCHLRSATRC
jgi:hypothetical protein